MLQKAREKELSDKLTNKVTRTELKHERSKSMLSEIITVIFPLPLEHRNFSWLFPGLSRQAIHL